MKTAHYLAAFLACTAITLGGISLLHAQQEAAPATPAAAAPVNDGFASSNERFFYAMGFQQAERVKQSSTTKKFDSEAFLKGFKDGAAGADSSYAEGLLMGAQMEAQKTQAKADAVDFDTNAFGQGLVAAMKGEKGRLDEAGRRAAFQAFQTEMQKKQQDAMEKAQAAAKAESAKKNAGDGAYLAANAKKDGWKTTQSGLQYHIITPGAEHPKAEDTVKVHYEGKFTDGEVFDASRKHGDQPIEFPLNGVIPGWTEAVQLIGKGGKMEIALPANLAYGDKGPRPGAAMLFTIELLDFKKAQ